VLSQEKEEIAMKWPIRNLLNPVATRSLLYGTDPFDLEYVLQKIDAIETMSGREIKNVWFTEWERKASHYLKYALEAENKGNRISAERFYMLIAQCYYASYMINTDDIEQKRMVYKKLEQYYAKSIFFRKNKSEYVEIPVLHGKVTGYIHYPDAGNSDKPYPCVMTYSGIGSCKEELDMLALPLLERGIAVLTVDMPGTGSSLFDYDLKCVGSHIDAAIDAMADFLEKRNDIDSEKIANFGLCMGGGYAFRASSKRKQTKCCVSLFPLFINYAKLDSIPVWMKRGKWANYQQGECDDYYSAMKILEEGTISCDFLMVHSADDNWMDTTASMSLFDKASGFKQQMCIDEKPAYVSEETIMHAMPVGEQFHWVKHIAADFIEERLGVRE
jgi:dienelactone hydrolase